MKAKSLIFRRLTSADFKNISGQGGVTGGGGQGYIDFNISNNAYDGINEKNLKKFFWEKPEKRTKGPAWTFEIRSLSLNQIVQNITIYQRRSSNFCIAAQKVGTRESNRVAAWDPAKTSFPSKKYDEESNPLYIYIIKDTENVYWAGWFYRNEFNAGWFLSKELLKVFADNTGACGYVELTNVDFDTNIRTWPFFGEKKKDKKTVMMQKEFEKFPLNWIFFGAPGTGKSFGLNKKAEKFDQQEISAEDKLPNEDTVKAEVKAALSQRGRKLSLLNAIGFKYADFWKTKNKKDIDSFCGNVRTGEIYMGAAAKNIVEDDLKKIEDPDNIDDDFIKDLIKNKCGKNDILKWANAIGYKYGNVDALTEKTREKLTLSFGLSDPQTYWLYRGIQAAQINSDAQEEEQDAGFVERVTFHPNYSYAQFVGTYKPVTKQTEKESEPETISYEYVPGPFMRMYKKALKNSKKCYLLIIEEINRANVAAVFGDVFQLLDRNAEGKSEYPVDASKDVRDYLLKNGIAECNKLEIPPNMFIWATMNSADQGVFPMDTAFKRRWEFEYIGINDRVSELVYEDDGSPILVPIPSKAGAEKNEGDLSYDLVKWNNLRMAINDKLSSIPSVNEDKLLGPFFISREKLLNAKNEVSDFIRTFKSKVLMYLYEDVVKISPTKLFLNCGDHPKYSDICTKFNNLGVGIFGYTLDEVNKIDESKKETV